MIFSREARGLHRPVGRLSSWVKIRAILRLLPWQRDVMTSPTSLSANTLFLVVENTVWGRHRNTVIISYCRHIRKREDPGDEIAQITVCTPNCNNVVIEKKQKAKKPNRNKLAM